MPEDTSQPAIETPLVPPAPTPTPSNPKISSKIASFFKSKKGKMIAIVALIAIVLFGSSAAAYYVVVVPNKPENILKTAVQNQLEKKQTSVKGSLSIDFKKTDASVKNVTVNFTGATDTPKQAFSSTLDVATSGAKLPVEIRGVDKSLYIKVGDLASVKGLAAVAGGKEAADAVDAFGSKLSNKWLEIDESLLKQVKAECTTSLTGGLSQQDIDQIMKVYSENAFMTVKSQTPDKVEGKDATKYELGFDKQKAQAFGMSLKSVDAFKKAADCAQQTTGQDVAGDKEVSNEIEDATKDTNITFYVWVDANKNLQQIQLIADDADATATLTVTFTNDAVNIQKPEGAKPIMEVLGDFSSFFGGSTGLGQGDDSTYNPLDELSDSCKKAYSDYVTSQGATPLPQECL